jgi:hypothetical protein
LQDLNKRQTTSPALVPVLISFNTAADGSGTSTDFTALALAQSGLGQATDLYLNPPSQLMISNIGSILLSYTSDQGPDGSVTCTFRDALISTNPNNYCGGNEVTVTAVQSAQNGDSGW